MEVGAQVNETSKLPPLRQTSHGLLPSQHRLDTLIRDISNKPVSNIAFSKKINNKDKELTGQSNKILLKSVSSVNRLIGKVKPEGRDHSDLNKYQPLALKTFSSSAFKVESIDLEA